MACEMSATVILPWPEYQHYLTGLRGQVPRPVRLPGGRPVAGDSGGVRVCPDCGYRGVRNLVGRCPVCTIPEVEREYAAVDEEFQLHSTMARMIAQKAGLIQRRAAPVPGRNDPCDCGSGRKAKRCCHG
jgi:hypothetical protein